MKKQDPVPEIDESLLTPEQKEELAKGHFPWVTLLVMGVLLLAIGICIALLFYFGGPLS